MTDGKQVWKTIVVGTTGGALALHHLCAPPTYLFFCIISNIEQFTEGNLIKYDSCFSDRANKESTIKNELVYDLWSFNNDGMTLSVFCPKSHRFL